MCMIDYSDSNGLWLDPPHEVTARKEHRCQNCRRTIAKGERYWYGKWLDNDGGCIMTIKHCSLCLIAAGWLDKVCNGHLWGDDAILSDLAEHWNEEPAFQCRSFAHLLAGMRSGWAGKTPAQVASLTRYATAHAERQLAAVS